VFDIARRLPPDPKALHGLLDSGSYLAKRNVSNLFEVITKAVAQAPNGPTVAEVLRGNNAPSTIGIGEVARAVLPQLRDRAKEGLDINDLIAHTSQLWGNMAISSRWDPDAPKPKQLRFELPWAQFVQSAKLADDTSHDAIQDMTMSEKMAIEHAVTEVSSGDLIPEDSEFTLKAGMKRKAPESESGSESDAEADFEPESHKSIGSKPGSTADDEEIAIDTDDSEKLKKARKARKAEKKALKLSRVADERKERKDRKRAEKLANTTQNSGSSSKEEQDEGDEPFDYSKAKSVLKASRSTTNGTGPPRKARFNPYGLTAEGPKPARRMHGEKLGKSATWKS
jgi:exosome complex exonuclease RRP6